MQDQVAPPDNAPHFALSEAGGVGMYMPCGDPTLYALCSGSYAGLLKSTSGSTAPCLIPVVTDMKSASTEITEQKAFPFVRFNREVPDKFLAGKGASGETTPSRFYFGCMLFLSLFRCTLSRFGLTTGFPTYVARHILRFSP
jgi:hypothetical protein